MTRRYRLDCVECSEDHGVFPDLLGDAYRRRVRPICLCRDPGVEMYIADIAGQLVIKRMPLTGGRHDAACPSYELPYELSGLGALMGTAIRLDGSDGVASLKPDFALLKRAKTARAANIGQGCDSVRVGGRKLSLRALLHFLWHESGLTEWTVNWSGRRHWWQVYHHLMEAAGHMAIRGEALTECLLIPEPFKAEERAAIEERRAHKLKRILKPSAGSRRLMVLVAEVKDFADARVGRQIVIKHMPGFRLHLEGETWKSVQRRFEPELKLWQSGQTSHLIMIATIASAAAGVVTVNEIALMSVSEQWLPIENGYEQVLIERLARLRSKSVKGLRFDLARGQPFANATLPEMKPRPVALYIVPPSADLAFEAKLKEMIEARPDLSAWVWRVANGEMPPLPLPGQGRDGARGDRA
ncbi:DUF1173 domain-containing protein [Rhizobium grahamii]|uniref:DUF1173 domain-containing protein n=1 Tax=Rhizobium grahamii TaxID=1120045 RepID=UPI0009DBD352|nr:DUF1173 domain-containing protein [Rhizobium grahamii]